MREVVDGVMCDTGNAQFVVGYGRGRGRGRNTGALYVMPGPPRRIFVVERRGAGGGDSGGGDSGGGDSGGGEPAVEMLDLGTAHVLLGEWEALGRIGRDVARMAAGTLDAVAGGREGGGTA